MTADGLRLSPRLCRCGGKLDRAIRVGPQPGQRTRTLCCFARAYEEPSLYGRSERERCPSGIARRQDTDQPGDWMPGRLALGRR